MRILPAILLIFGALFQYAHPFSEECPHFVCGKLGELRFPFTNTTQNDSCGPFVVKGCDKLDSPQVHPQVQFVRGKGKWFEVTGISQGDSISIIDTDFQALLEGNSCKSFTNLSFPILPFAPPLQIIPNLTLFKCPPNVTVDPSLTKLYHNHTGCSPHFTIYYHYPPPPKHLSTLPGCTILQLPLKTNSINQANIFQLLTPNFSLQANVLPQCYYCYLSGKCDGEFPHCVSYNPRAYAERRKNKRVIIPIVTAASFAAGIVLISVYFVINFCWSKTGKDAEMIEVALRNQHSLAPRRYRYSEVKRITRAFREKLGKGGYGSVFKGELPNGRLVAVKVLKDSKSNGEDFVNEVSSISRTSHVNIVTLLGFCFEGSMRALIYEFMPNGSLDKYIYDENTKEDHRLRTETLYQITVGIAQGLEYLHRGCNTRILHFDIKPHNILLDENFCPKISDFGLAKVCIRNDSIVSLMGARGTVGYIAPEVFCRNIGGVSHKSDVYSYGMMVLEMVGGRKNVCVEVDRSSEIYFPHWIYNRIELGEELGLLGISNDEEKQLARKMIVVSLWCIQTNPLNRPPMCRVVEMLQGSLESLPIPPKPYLSSPSSSPVNAFGDSSSSARAKFSGDQLLVS